MFTIFYKKITPTTRYRTKLISFKNKFNKNNKYSIYSYSKSGRNITGIITARSKLHKNKYTNFVHKYDAPFILKFFFLRWNIFIKSLKKKISFFKDTKNNFFYLPSIYGNVVGSKYKLFFSKLKKFSLLTFGLPIYLYLVPNYYIISNIYHFLKKKVTYVTASGCFSTKIPKKKKDKFYKVILPSKQIKKLDYRCICFLGKNNLQKKKKIQPGKAGYNILLGKKQIVRGVAMNPVDHPNGGRCKSPAPERSPWGWIAKLNK